MQTFVPYPDFRQSAECLDRQRLGKQRVETLQILRALAGMSTGWINHPAVKMWRGYEGALTLYGITTCEVWKERGYKDTCKEKMLDIYKMYFNESSFYEMPEWWGGDIHITHQSKLISKKPEHYKNIFPEAPLELEYLWPI